MYKSKWVTGGGGASSTLQWENHSPFWVESSQCGWPLLTNPLEGSPINSLLPGVTPGRVTLVHVAWRRLQLELVLLDVHPLMTDVESHICWSS